MLPLLSLIPAIFEAVTAVPKLFDEGKRAYEAVTGKPSAAETPAELAAIVETLPTDKKEAWTATMKAKLDLYQAETERLALEQGRVTGDVLEALPPDTRAKVALMRMTTRPWAVRRMVWVLMLPFYIVVVDGALTLANIFLK